MRDWDIGLPEYWGKLGHFAMAQRAVALLAPGPLRAFLETNLDAIKANVDRLDPEITRALREDAKAAAPAQAQASSGASEWIRLMTACSCASIILPTRMKPFRMRCSFLQKL